MTQACISPVHTSLHWLLCGGCVCVSAPLCPLCAESWWLSAQVWVLCCPQHCPLPSSRVAALHPPVTALAHRCVPRARTDTHRATAPCSPQGPACPFQPAQEMLTHRINQKLGLVLPFTELGPNLAPTEAAGMLIMLIILSRSWNWPLCCIL